MTISNTDPRRPYFDRAVNLEHEARTAANGKKDLRTEMTSKKVSALDIKAIFALAKEHVDDAEKNAKRVAFEEKKEELRVQLGLFD